MMQCQADAVGNRGDTASAWATKGYELGVQVGSFVAGDNECWNKHDTLFLLPSHMVPLRFSQNTLPDAP